MRLYTFTNMYLSQIQKGIQSAHVTHEIMQKHPKLKSDTQVWAKEHKTMIVLDGGYASNLVSIGDILSKSGYDSIGWRESEEALNNALTCVGAVLPEKIYILAQYARQNVANVKLLEQEDAEAPKQLIAVPNDELLDNTELVKQLEDFGIYSEAEVALVNELNKYRLA